MTAGKGSGRRPANISREEWERRHALTFGPKKPRPQPRRKPRRQK